MIKKNFLMSPDIDKYLPPFCSFIWWTFFTGDIKRIRWTPPYHHGTCIPDFTFSFSHYSALDLMDIESLKYLEIGERLFEQSTTGFLFFFYLLVRKKIRFWNSCWTSTETWDINCTPVSRTSDGSVILAPHQEAHCEVWEISVQTLVSSYFCVTLCICLLNSWITFPSRGTKCYKLSRLQQHALLAQFCRSGGQKSGQACRAPCWGALTLTSSCGPGCTLVQRLWVRSCFQARSGGCWNSVPRDWRTEVPSPCWLAAGSSSQHPKGALGPCTWPLHLPNRIVLMPPILEDVWKSLTSHSATSQWKHSNFRGRTWLARPTRIIFISSGQLTGDFNYIGKIPSQQYLDSCLTE